MTLKDLIAADVSSVFLNTDEFAEVVTRYPGGNTGAGVAVTVDWVERGQERDRKAGDQTERIGDLFVAGDLTVTITDTWLIGSEVWQTQTVGFVEGGGRTLTLTRHDKRETIPDRRQRYT